MKANLLVRLNEARLQRRFMRGTGERAQLYDALRALAAFGIVWYHLRVPGFQIAYAGLVVFVLLSVALTSERDGSLGRSIGRRCVKLLLPWAIWTIIYASTNALLLRPAWPYQDGFAGVILAGSSIHLWYLPFICVVFLVVRVLIGVSNRLLLARGVWVLALFSLITAPVWRPWSILLDLPFPQYMHAIPAVLVGMFLRFSSIATFRSDQLLALVLLLVALGQLDLPGVGLPYGIGMMAVFVVQIIRCPIEYTHVFRWLSDRTFGIYLIHPLVIMPSRRLMQLDGI